LRTIIKISHLKKGGGGVKVFVTWRFGGFEIL
jgi:hypothetical protein